jgi:hypothetical protein
LLTPQAEYQAFTIWTIKDTQDSEALQDFLRLPTPTFSSVGESLRQGLSSHLKQILN